VCGSGLVVEFVVRWRLVERFGDQAEILVGAHFEMLEGIVIWRVGGLLDKA
jgi:hypothetical protein